MPSKSVPVDASNSVTLAQTDQTLIKPMVMPKET